MRSEDGRQQPAYEPEYEPIRDDVIGKLFAPCCVRSCPEPHVIARYGVGGVANVSIWTCKKCRFHREYKYHGGVSCIYGLGQIVPPGKKG